MANIMSCLWFEKDAAAAVRFYTATIPGSAPGRVTTLPAQTPSGPPGSVHTYEFTLAGIPYVALEAGPLDAFNHSHSIQVVCETQEELDRIWNAFLDNGGEAQQCGWLRDRWGLYWQIFPRQLTEMIAAGGDKARRVTEAMLGMVKIDLAALDSA